MNQYTEEPLYYITTLLNCGHLSKQDTFSHPKYHSCMYFNLWNEDTSLTMTLSSAPLVSGLERFHCTIMMVVNYLRTKWACVPMSVSRIRRSYASGRAISCKFTKSLNLQHTIHTHTHTHHNFNENTHAHTHARTYPVARLVSQVQLALHGFKGHPWLLHHQLHVHGLVGLQPDNELVSSGALRGKYVAGRVLELHTDLRLPLIESYVWERCILLLVLASQWGSNQSLARVQPKLSEDV